MRPFRLLTALSAVAVVAIATPAMAGPVQPYSVAAFTAAQMAGKPILIHVHADWCPICRRQAPIVAEIANDPKFAKLVVFKIDFDSQVPEREAFKVRQQSTLIAFKGKAEKGRSLGVTDRTEIRSLAATALR
jgi:thioredoxin 1